VRGKRINLARIWWCMRFPLVFTENTIIPLTARDDLKPSWLFIDFYLSQPMSILYEQKPQIKGFCQQFNQFLINATWILWVNILSCPIYLSTYFFMLMCFLLECNQRSTQVNMTMREHLLHYHKLHTDILYVVRQLIHMLPCLFHPLEDSFVTEPLCICTENMN